MAELAQSVSIEQRSTHIFVRKMSEQFDLSDSPFRVDFGAERFVYLLDSNTLLGKDVYTSTAEKDSIRDGDFSSLGLQE